ncbi:unnamed protein product [Blumeria hordei]|uniref:Uncharacterized protein n=2 Tax=Blumeria hordei TaxID=2867405 RepID=A0A383UYX1_BLUHO|nr:class I peptide chain release factor/hypothetical protein [Blumeria hordei DH14]SZF04788.1 unnamed protein product [Blumeria hordei]
MRVSRRVWMRRWLAGPEMRDWAYVVAAARGSGCSAGVLSLAVAGKDAPSAASVLRLHSSAAHCPSLPDTVRRRPGLVGSERGNSGAVARVFRAFSTLACGRQD